ncbi:MAG TPA: hypothetical protein VHA11_09255 [Bryobacteraceae bacterium]|nr:hypothetical protein [Bryobacteraceae bacterium]
MRPSRKTFVMAAVLFLLNLWFVKELLTAEFLEHMFSIEGAYIALARYIAANWHDLLWFPLWYGGIPFQNTYLPLLHLTVAAVSKLLGLAPGLAYHATTAVLYSLGPVTLFLLAKELSKSRAYSFAAALLYSLTSPSLALIPVVRYDAGSVWHARRLQALVQYGEGPHIAALTLLPLALLLVALAVRKRRPVWWVLAGLAMAAVALTNYIGAFALAAALPAWLLSTPEGTRPRPWLAVAATGAYAYAIACCWIPPSTLANVPRMEMLLMGAVAAPHVRLLWAAGAALAMLSLAFALRRMKAPPAFSFSVLFLIPMAAVTLAAQWFQVSLLPQAPRCHLEMEMAIVLAAAFGAKLVLDRLPARAQIAIACLLLAAAVFPTIKYRRYARRLDRRIDIQRTIEYREARWFAEHVPGRVMAPGSVGFFLNAFTDVPQFSGGFEQGTINVMVPYFRYQILSGQNAGEREGEVAVVALKAFGVDAVGVSGPRSQEPFKPFRNPNKFAGLLAEAWRDGDDVIYRVPRRSASLAHVIRPGDLPSREPIHGLDIDPLLRYVAALDDPALPPADLRWHNRHAAAITAAFERGQILSVQISYHPEWSATVNGAPRRVFRDHLGQLAVEPACAGPCTVELSYDGGSEMRMARAVSWMSLLGGLVWIVIARRR